MSAKAKLKYVLFGAVFAGGFASLSLELAVMRQLSGFVGSTAVTASIIIGVLLAFMSLGYYRGFYGYRADVGAGFLLYSD